MLTRKNIYHYILYVIFALIFFCGIGLYSVSLNPVSSDNGAILPLILRYAIVFVSAALVVLIVKFVVPHLPEKYVPEKLPVFPKSIETVIVVIVPVLMIFLRIIVITSRIGEDINNIYYNYAINASDNLTDTTFATYAYASICRLLCKINATPYPIYAFNALLQIGVAEFSYFALKKSLRIRYALLVFLLIAFLPFSVNATMIMSPDILFSFLFAGYIYYLFVVNDLNTRGKISENYHMLLFVGLGLLSGFIAMCDILGISLFVLTITSLILVYNREAYLNFQKRPLQIFLYVISFIIFLSVFLYFVPNNGFDHLTNVFNYIFSFVPNGLSLTFNSPMESRYEGIVLFVFAAVAIFAFIRNEADRGLFAVIVLDFATILSFVKFNTTEYAYLVNYFYIIFAVIGFFAAPGFLGEPEEVIIKRPVYSRSREYTHSSSNTQKLSKLETVRSVPVRPSRPAPPTIPGRPVQEKTVIKSGTATENKEPQKISLINSTSSTENNDTKITAAVESANENVSSVITENANASSVSSASYEASRNDDYASAAVNAENVSSESHETSKSDASASESDNAVSESKDSLSSDNEKRDKIVPSRRDYKTAHVYKDKAEEEMHKMKVANEGISLVETDPNLKATPMIKNPLPTPKPHVTRELTYDYDLEEGDDFDIKDLKGKDYYDI